MHGVYIYDFLFNWDEKLDAKPQMVGDYNVSADSLTYSFKLRPDRKSTRLNSSHVSESRMPSSA